jgi:hypothetical protein
VVTAVFAGAQSWLRLRRLPAAEQDWELATWLAQLTNQLTSDTMHFGSEAPTAAARRALVVKAAASATLAANAWRKLACSRAEHMRLLAEWRSHDRIAHEGGDRGIALLAALVKGLHDYAACQNMLAFSRKGGGKWRTWLALVPFLNWLTPLAGWFFRRSRDVGRPPGLRRMQFSSGMMALLTPPGFLFILFYFVVYPFFHLPATVSDVRGRLRKRGK